MTGSAAPRAQPRGRRGRHRVAAVLVAGAALLAACGTAGAAGQGSDAASPVPAPASGASGAGSAPSAGTSGGYGGATSSPPAGVGLYTAPADGQVVYLSFDDGPDPKSTPQVLDLLAQYDAKGTFFVVGRYVRRHPELLARATQAGNSVQSHSNTHPQLTTLPDATVTDVQLRPVSILIRKASGVAPTCLRPPYGDYDARIAGLAGDLGLRIAMWDVDSLDWKNPGPQAIADRVLAQVRPGSVILMHDGGADRAQTVAALRILLPALKDRGYSFGVMCREG